MMEHRNAESIQEENVQSASPVHHQYSRERLLELKKVPAARSKPYGLSKEFYTSDGIWDPEKWFKAFSASREGSPLTISDGRERRRPTDLDRESLFRRRLSDHIPTSDPKERLREERDCIVLSPQRRSFGTGCHVTLSGIGRQISCPPDFKDSGGQRERTRRIGSGRIQLEKDHNSRYDNRDERFERNENSRAEGFRSSVHDRRDMSHRRVNPSGRRRSFRRQEEDTTPEWFTDGPNSQADTIELRGFDGVGDQQEEDIEDEELHIGEVNRKEFLGNIDEENISNISVSERNGSLETNESSSPEDSPPSDNVHGTPPQTSSLFDFDQFIQINIPIPMLGMMPDTGGEESEANQGSRFSRWFSRASNQGSRTNSRRSSLTDENGFIQDLIETQSPTTISSSSTSPTVLGSLSLPPPSQDPHLQQHPPSLLHQPHTSAALSQQSHPPQPLQQAPPQLHQQLHQLQQQQQKDKTPSSLFSVNPHRLGRSSPSSPQHKQDCHPPVPPSPTNVASTHSTNILQGKMSMLDSYSQHQPKNSVLNSLFSLKPDAGRSCSPSGSGVSAQDASAQLKALLFGKDRNETVSASPTPNMPPYNMPGQVKTLAEIEADMHHPPSNNGMVSVSPVMEVPDCSGDMSAFNKLLSMMKAAAVDSSKTQMQDRSTSVPPPQTIPYNLTSGQNEFLHALSRNKERQLQIQQQTLQQIRMQQMQQQMHHQQASQSQQHSAGPPPPPTTGGSGTTVNCTQYSSGQQASSDAILNFIKQNPAIITKPASPSPQLAAVFQQTAPRTQSPGAPPLHSGPPPQFLQQNLLAAQQSSMHSTSQQRIPSPIMFSQQPPVHLSAPAPVHPSPLVASSLAQSVNTNLTNVGSIRPQGLLHRVTSPQEMASVQSQVLTQMAMKKKKELDDQKERILRKQQADRSKSPVHFLNQRGIPTPVNVNNSNKTSVSVSFTPTSVIRKMHSEKAVEKERQAKQDGCNTNSYSAQKALAKGQMFGDSVLKDVYLNSCDNVHGSCDSGDNERGHPYGPGSMNGPSLMKNQDGGAAAGIVNLSHGQQQSHSNLPMDSSIVGGSMNMSVTSSSSVTSSPTSSAKSSKSTSHDTSLSGNAGEILAAQLLNHEQNSSPSQASSSSPCDQSKSVRALIGQGMMQNLSVHMQQNVPSTAATSAAQQLTATLSGRPIVKGSINSANTLCPVGGLQSLPPSGKVDRSVASGGGGAVNTNNNSSSSNTNNLDMKRFVDQRLQQQQRQQQQQQQQVPPLLNVAAAAGIARSLSLNSTSSPFGIQVNSRVPPPLQSNAIPPNIGVHPAANIQMQLMFQGMNPLAAMHAHRSTGLESRFPSGMRGVYPGMVPPMLGPRASLAAAAAASSIGVPSNPAAGGVVNVGVGRAVSPQIPSLHKQGMSVPGSSGQKTSLQSLGLSNTGGTDVLKCLFDSEVLRTQLPNMPLPPQGQKVVTVDELERCQQAVSN